MNREKEIEQQLESYQSLAKEDKNIDAASLMMNALDQKSNLVSAKQRKWAYIISLGFPPLGLLFALKFYFGEEDDARRMAGICVILTIISVFLLWLSFKIFLSGSGSSINQIEQINPKDFQDLLQ